MSTFTVYAAPVDPAHEHLIPWGWDAHFNAALDPDETGHPARVVGVRRNSFILADGSTEFTASASGKLRHGIVTPFPVAGDWVLVEDTVITRVLSRKNVLVRGASGTRSDGGAGAVKEQVMAANLAHVFIVCGLDRDFNVRRIERCLTLAYDCGLSPVVVLTKADLHPAPEIPAMETEAVAPGVPVHAVASPDGTGLDAMDSYLAPGRTIALIGSSGAGKSTLVNSLAGKDLRRTGAVSDHVKKGKHTTTTRDLIRLPQGGMIIDNPGIREIALWGSGEGLAGVFTDIDGLAGECRFHDCAHTGEPGCRVRAAVESGELEPERLESYLKMKRESDYLAERQAKSANRVEKERFRDISLRIKAMNKHRRKRK